MQPGDSGRLERAGRAQQHRSDTQIATNQRMVDTVGQTGVQGFQQIGQAMAQAPMIQARMNKAYVRLAHEQLQIDQFNREAALFDKELYLREKKARVEMIESQAARQSAEAKHVGYGGVADRGFMGLNVHREGPGRWYSRNFNPQTGQVDRSYLGDEDTRMLDEAWKGRINRDLSLTQAREARQEDIRARTDIAQQRAEMQGALTDARVSEIRARIEANRSGDKAEELRKNASLVLDLVKSGTDLKMLEKMQPDLYRRLKPAIDRVAGNMGQAPAAAEPWSDYPGMTRADWEAGLQRFGSEDALRDAIRKRTGR